MAITYSIDTKSSVLSVTVSGTVSLQDFAEYFRATSDDHSYSTALNRLIHIEDSAVLPPSAEIADIAHSIRARTSDSSARVAVIAGSPLVAGMSRLVVLSGLRDRLQFFPEKTTAMYWLLLGKRNE